MSDYSDFIDETISTIQSSVTGFDTTTVPNDVRHIHKYAPWNPLELVPDGNRHLAMWPTSDAEVSEALAQGGLQHIIRTRFAILAWEGAATQDGRQFPDETADKAWLDAANALRAYFYVEARRQRSYSWGGYYRINHEATSFPEEPGAVRWAALLVSADRSIDFT